MRNWIVGALSTLMLAAAFSPTVAGVPDALDLDAIRNQQAEIRAGVNAQTGLYEDMAETTRRDLISRQDRVLRTIDGKQTSSDLTDDQRMAVFNDLEWIEAAINKAEGERMVCERRKKLGSNRTERVCMTVAQQQEMRERARQELMGDVRNMRVGN